jgi:phytol kinase
MNQWVALAVSYAAVFAVVGTAGVLGRKEKISGEAARKVIHIGVSNWIILAFFTFHDWYFAIIGPLSFIVINFVSWKLDLFKGMESGDKSPGTVFFAVSLSILVWHFWWMANTGVGDFRYAAVMGILVLGWGDGLAAVFGHKWGKAKLVGSKTLVGTLAMFVTSAVVVFTVLTLVGVHGFLTNILLALGLGALATLAELFLPGGWDNLFIPLVVSYAYYGWFWLTNIAAGGVF